MFEKVLIANRARSPFASRACRELGVESVAIYSTADAESAVVKFADESVCVGPPAVGKSYLHIPNIIGAAQKTGADAIHPGYGFLSEDPFFAEICADNDITFIGPKPEVMEKVGDKAIARDLMQKAGLPPARHDRAGADGGRGAGDRRRHRLPRDHQGGRRRRRPRHERGLQVRGPRSPVQDHARAAQAIFKDSAVYIERYLEAPRHTEVQLVCDGHGSGVYFYERDCSVQRRHQKLIEEAPSVHLSDEQRRDIGERAVNGALSVGYTGAGTMEFLLDDDGNLSFMEMNARIQVEHPVSEMITSSDLIQEQIRVASGEPLSVSQESLDAARPLDRVPDQRGGPGQGLRPRGRRLDVYEPPGGPGASTPTATRAGRSRPSTTR